MLTASPVYAFSATISGTSSHAKIDRVDGKAVEITEAELPDLLLDLAADGSGMPGRAKHHHLVLGEWFARKCAAAPPAPARHLRLVG